MLVYGDHDRLAKSGTLLSEITEDLLEIRRSAPGIARHAKLVATFISAGQLLQAVADEDFRAVGRDRRTGDTDALTRLLHALAECVRDSWDSGFAELGALPGLPALPERRLSLRLPEGFAFYAVYPEAFIETARQLTLSGPPRVIGLRSIGTTLAAAVAAALRAEPPVTVRPFGDPYARQVAISDELEAELLSGGAHYVIVDEGPGQSGSSFAAMAEWLRVRGVPSHRIAFVPSHANAPGAQASERTREIWSSVQRVPADFGERLPQMVERWFEAEIGKLDAPLQEISGGDWRRLFDPDERRWPSATPMWERRKFLAEAGGERFLLKFAGLGPVAERKLRMARALHGAGLCSEPIGLLHGFLVERWCESARPVQDGHPSLDHIARYIGARARLFPAAGESGASMSDLLDMARRNIGLAFGDAAVERLPRWSERLDTLQPRVVRVRTDNRMARQEWLRSADGRLIKADALDHHQGHDLIGCQDAAWDVAGAIIEFDLAEPAAASLIAQTESAAGRHIDRELLEFYLIAYAAFRLGQAAMAQQMSGTQSPEIKRLEPLRIRFVSRLQDLLQLSGSAATQPQSLVD